MTDLLTLLDWIVHLFEVAGIAYFMWLAVFSSYVRPLNAEAWHNTKRWLRRQPMEFEETPTITVPLTPRTMELLEEWAGR